VLQNAITDSSLFLTAWNYQLQTASIFHFPALIGARGLDEKYRQPKYLHDPASPQHLASVLRCVM
jgi:hypothetical protein